MRGTPLLCASACLTIAVACSQERPTDTPASGSGVHEAGILDPRSPAFHGTVLRASRWSPMLDANDASACGRCHDGSVARPAGVTAAAPGAPSCTTCHDQPGGVLACSTCHGSGDRSYTGAAHAAHVERSPAAAGGTACSTCHPVPGTPVIGGLHGDGVVQVSFDPLVVPGAPTYDASSGACAGSCHDHGGASPRVTWTETTAIGCGDCHGSPPAGHFKGACSGCHAEANAAGTAVTAGPLHLNGKVDLGDGTGLCGACHGSGDSPWPKTAAHPAHRNPTLASPVACETCHVVPARVLDPTHLDGTVHVVLAGLATARGANPAWTGAACTNVACHGANLPDLAAAPAWSDPSGAASRCGACHGVPPSQHTTSASCDRSDCHGSEVTLGANGAPLISASGASVHVDGLIESAR